MKSYPPEFKADAVALYLSDPARTYASVARDLGINRETLRLWVKEARADGTAGAKKAGPAKKPAGGPLSSDDVLEEENPRCRGERFLGFLGRLARAAGPSEPGGIEELDESIPTRRSSCSISAINAAITASRSASATSSSSRLQLAGSGITSSNYDDPSQDPCIQLKSARVPQTTLSSTASVNGYTCAA
ncbi:transposase [Nonomuraea sp. B12E4]|uniref:transposase n=1 Tax=Nonomuraea sp. B12E4 TaxID=3153564 RepID=UPI00325CD53B